MLATPQKGPTVYWGPSDSLLNDWQLPALHHKAKCRDWWWLRTVLALGKIWFSLPNGPCSHRETVPSCRAQPRASVLINEVTEKVFWGGGEDAGVDRCAPTWSWPPANPMGSPLKPMPLPHFCGLPGRWESQGGHLPDRAFLVWLGAILQLKRPLVLLGGKSQQLRDGGPCTGLQQTHPAGTRCLPVGLTPAKEVTT